MDPQPPPALQVVLNALYPLLGDGDRLTFCRAGGRVVVRLSLPDPEPPPPAAASPAAGARGRVGPAYAHSDDFASVVFAGRLYRFSEAQARVVACLWDHWVRGVPIVGDHYLLNISGSTASELRDVFKQAGGRMHDAWNTVIVKGSAQLTHCLAGDPPPEG